MSEMYDIGRRIGSTPALRLEPRDPLVVLMLTPLVGDRTPLATSHDLRNQSRGELKHQLTLPLLACGDL